MYKGFTDLSKNGSSSKIFWTLARDQVLRGREKEGGKEQEVKYIAFVQFQSTSSIL